MNMQEKISKLQAIKEEFAATQARLEAAKRLQEAAEATYLATLLENDLEQAEIILAAKDIMAKLQDMAEDLAKLNAQEVFPLVDEMKAAFGPEAADMFENLAQNALQAALNSVRKAKEDINSGILQVEGKLPMNDMSVEPTVAPDMAGPTDTMAPDTMLGDIANDEFGGAEGAAGLEGDPMGRAKKESIDASGDLLEGKTHRRDDDDDDEDPRAKKKAAKFVRDEKKTKRKIEESLILESAGQKLLETEGLESLLTWYLKEAASAMPAEEYPEFAAKVSAKAAKNPAKMAGYIGQKKYGAAAMAQLAQPTFTSGMMTSEGRTYRYDDDNYGYSAKGKADKAWRKARKERRNIDDTPDKEDEKMTESERKALAMAKIIESNILIHGKGNAAQVVKQFSENTLVEGETETETILEAFESMFGMKPAQFSITMAKELAEDNMSPTDKRKLDQAMASVASQMATDKSTANKPVSAIMSKLEPQDRAAIQKKQAAMRKDGKNPQKVADLVTNTDESLEENINAAHWPVDSMGQYKGDLVEPDLEPLKTAKAETKVQPEQTTAPEPKPEAEESEATEATEKTDGKAA